MEEILLKALNPLICRIIFMDMTVHSVPYPVPDFPRAKIKFAPGGE